MKTTTSHACGIRRRVPDHAIAQAEAAIAALPPTAFIPSDAVMIVIVGKAIPTTRARAAAFFLENGYRRASHHALTLDVPPLHVLAFVAIDEDRSIVTSIVRLTPLAIGGAA